jgi:hypothetical protein
VKIRLRNVNPEMGNLFKYRLGNTNGGVIFQFRSCMFGVQLTELDNITNTNTNWDSTKTYWSDSLQFEQRLDAPSGHITFKDFFSLAGRDGKYLPSRTRDWLNDSNVAWMHNNLKWLGHRPLRHICMPSSHDAGMSQFMDRAFLGSAVKETVQTQIHSVQEQLQFGVRCFDIRPFLYMDRWFVGHFSDEIPAGAVGESLQMIAEGINIFTSKSPELIILDISHVQKFYDLSSEEIFGNSAVRNFVGVGGGDNKKLSLAVDASAEEYRDCLQTLARLLNNLCPRTLLKKAPDGDLTKLELNEFIGDGSAKVIVRIKDDTKGYDFVKDGLSFFKRAEFPFVDEYANNPDGSQVITNQINNLRLKRKSPNDEMYMLNWTITQDKDAAVNATARHWTPNGVITSVSSLFGSDFGLGNDTSILSSALNFNKRLGRELLPHCSRDSYPNFINLDGINNCDALMVSQAINIIYGKH